MVCVCPARSRMFADQWQYEVRILEPRDQPTRRTSEFAISRPGRRVRVRVVIKSGCGSSCSGIAHRSNLPKVAHSLKGLSASMSRSICKPQLKRTSRHGSSVLCRMGSL